MNLQRFILNALDAVPEDRMLSAETVAGLLPVGVAATPDDVRLCLKALAAKRQVAGITTDDGLLWKITPNGKARLA